LTRLVENSFPKDGVVAAFVKAHYDPFLLNLDYATGDGKALEGNAHRILHARGVEAADDLITEKGAVHPHLDRDPGQGRPHDSDTAKDEVLGCSSDTEPSRDRSFRE
jgi:hypothetical protein